MILRSPFWPRPLYEMKTNSFKGFASTDVCWWEKKDPEYRTLAYETAIC